MITRLQYVFAILLIVHFSVGCSKVQQLAETVASQGLNIATPSLSPAVVNEYYVDNITGAGGAFPYTFTVVAGALPTGLSLSAAGALTGTPTVIGNYNFTVQLTDSDGAVTTTTFGIPVTSELVITTAAMPTAQVSVAYALAIAVTGGSGTYSYSATGLPAGFSISPVSGIISGTSALSSDNTVVVTVADSNGLQESATYSFSVASAPVITTTTLNAAAASYAYSANILTTGGKLPLSYSLDSGTLPTGMSLSAAGVLSGTPTFGTNVANSPHIFVVKVTDSLGQTDLQLLSLTVSLAPRVVDDFRHLLRAARVGVAYLDFVKTEGGTGVKTFSATGLPAGLTLNATSGFISGTPVGGTAGTYTVNVTITDSLGLATTRAKTLTVSGATLTNINYGAPIQTPLGLYNANWAYPNDIDIADLNGDFINDIAYSAQDSRGIVIMIGDGLGNFTKTFFASPGALRPRFIKIADMNGDAFLDVVTGTVDNRIEVYLANVAGWPAAPVTRSYNVAVDNYGFDVGDMNGDGAKDIVFTNWTNNEIRVLYNCGAGANVNIPGVTACNMANAPLNMHNVSVAALSQPRDVVLHNFDGAGGLDIIATSYNGAAVGIVLGNNNGTYGAIYTRLTGAAGVRGIAKGDMNGDGRMDVVTTGDNAIAVMINTAGVGPQNVNLTSTAFAINDLAINSEFVDVADMNGDGFPDVAFSAGGVQTNSLGVFINDQTGELINRQIASPGNSNMGVRLAPILTASVILGKPDLVTAVGHWVGFSRLLVYPNSNLTTTPYHFGQSYFNAPPVSAVTTHGMAMPGDLNNDGYNDLMFKVGGAANILFGQADATFTLSSSSVPTGDISATWWHSRQMAVADLNGDGNLDMVSGNWNGGGTGTVTSVLGNGDGTFGSQFSFAVDQVGCTANLGVRALDVADFNRDGKMDLVVAVGCTSTPQARAYVYFGNADGSFNTGTRQTLNGDQQTVLLVAAVDVNKDGNTDVVMVSATSVIQQYTNNGAGAFTLFGTNDFTVASSLSSLMIGDIDGNGYLDYAVSSASTATMARVLSTGTGTVTGGSVTTFSGLAGDYLSQITNGAVMYDYDLDGRLDIVTMRRFQDMNPANRNGGGGLHFMKGNGAGTFTAQAVVLAPACYGPYSEGLLSTADVNGDGKLDIINTNAYNAAGGGIGVNVNHSN